MRWSLENLWKITKFIVRLTRERKKGRKKAVFGRNSQKLTKSAKKNRKKVFQPKILKFYGGRWTPWSNAPVWAPTSHTLADLAKKSQKVPNEKISPPQKFFSSSKKGLKRWKKWLRSGRKRFRRGEIEVRWRKKKNKKIFWDFNGPNGHEGAPNLPIRQHFLSSCSKSWVSKSGVGLNDFSNFKSLVPEDGFKTTFLVTKRSWEKTLPPWKIDF